MNLSSSYPRRCYEDEWESVCGTYLSEERAHQRLEKLSRHEPLLDEEPEDDVIAELLELYGTEDAADCMPLD